MRLPATDYEFMNTVRCTELNVCNFCYLFERQRALVMIILNAKVNIFTDMRATDIKLRAGLKTNHGWILGEAVNL